MRSPELGAVAKYLTPLFADGAETIPQLKPEHVRGHEAVIMGM